MPEQMTELELILQERMTSETSWTRNEKFDKDGYLVIKDLWNPKELYHPCLLYTSPSPRDLSTSRMPSSA